MNPQPDPLRPAQFSRTPQTLLGKVLSLLLGATFLVLAVMFSVVALAVVAVGAVFFAGWFWWKTRSLRKAMRENRASDQQAFGAHAGTPQGTSPENAMMIEGEFVREAPPTDCICWFEGLPNTQFPATSKTNARHAQSARKMGLFHGRP
jgi:hypothetical protein